jgi:nitroreductase
MAGTTPREERKNAIKDLFQFPDNIQPLSLISIGYPNEEKEQPERFKKERIHYNQW